MFLKYWNITLYTQEPEKNHQSTFPLQLIKLNRRVPEKHNQFAEPEIVSL